MGWNPLKKIGKGLKRLVTNPKKWAQNAGKSAGGALDIVSDFLPPGPWKTLGEVGGSVLQGNNMKEHLMSGVGSVLPGIGKIPGLSQLGGKIGGFGGGKLGDLLSGGVKRVSGLLPDSIKGGFGNIGDLASKAGGFISGHPDELLAAGQGLYGAYAANKANQLRGRALSSAEGSYKERAPLRRMALEGLTNPVAPDTSGLIDLNNPYARPRLKRLGGA